jgi:thiosulfate/3-mercaptopyruvate sulfurtransferase
MLRLFGHDNVALLDGGLPKWKAEGRPLETAAPAIPPRHFTARFRPELVRDKEAIRANITARREQVVDARAAGRFEGTADELWPGRRRGHIPDSRNLPFDLVTDRTTKQLRSADELRRLFDEAGAAIDRPIVTSCGSGRLVVGMGAARRHADRDRSRQAVAPLPWPRSKTSSPIWKCEQSRCCRASRRRSRSWR